jgi:hypothetical protein
MILTDTGPLIALLDRNDINHQKYVEAAKQMAAEPLLTTWLCFAKAMYILGEIGVLGINPSCGSCGKVVAFSSMISLPQKLIA